MKPSAAEPRLSQHRGPAIVFRDYNHMAAEMDRDDLEVTPDHVLVLQNAGPKGGPGMPEWGMLPIPSKLVRAGVRDMLRLSDARMSGTSYGACILHVAPESFIGGPLALVQTGDEIEVDVAQRRLHLHVSDEELARRRSAWVAPPPATSAATAACSRSTSAKPTPAATSTSWSTAPPVPEPEIALRDEKALRVTARGGAGGAASWALSVRLPPGCRQHAHGSRRCRCVMGPSAPPRSRGRQPVGRKVEHDPAEELPIVVSGLGSATTEASGC